MAVRAFIIILLLVCDTAFAAPPKTNGTTPAKVMDIAGKVQGVSGASSTVYKINFEASSTSTPSGYSKDYGLGYDSGRGYGWTYSNGNAADFTGSGRERSINSDKRYDTLMQIAPPNLWKLTIANGTYSVKVVVGDAGYAITAQYVQVEGVTFQDNVSLSANTFSDITHDVTVSDGALTVAFAGATQTKICFIEVTSK